MERAAKLLFMFHEPYDAPRARKHFPSAVKKRRVAVGCDEEPPNLGRNDRLVRASPRRLSLELSGTLGGSVGGSPPASGLVAGGSAEFEAWRRVSSESRARSPHSHPRLPRRRTSALSPHDLPASSRREHGRGDRTRRWPAARERRRGRHAAEPRRPLRPLRRGRARRGGRPARAHGYQDIPRRRRRGDHRASRREQARRGSSHPTRARRGRRGRQERQDPAAGRTCRRRVPFAKSFFKHLPRSRADRRRFPLSTFLKLRPAR